MNEQEQQTRNNAHQSDCTLTVNHVAVRLPSFIAADPEHWFAMVEESFACANVTIDYTRFSYAAGVLEPRFGLEVRVIVQKPSEDAYAVLKTELIKRLSSSQEEKKRRLLEREEVGDMKEGKTVPEQMLRILWLTGLPCSMQQMLATHKFLQSVEKLADLAYSIADIYCIATNRPMISEAATVDSLPSQFKLLAKTLRQETPMTFIKEYIILLCLI